ncbi:MAG: phage minor tail protein L [Planctomycetota bacterium]
MQQLTQTATADPWVELLAFTLPQGRHLRVANNTANITYGGEVYVGKAFEPEIVELTKDARMPSYQLRLSHVGGELVEFLRKAGGLEGQTVTATLVNTNDLAADYSELTTVYSIRSHVDAEETIAFEIGGPNLYRWRHPFRRYMPNLCEVRYKGPLCGYAGSAGPCTYSLAACRARGNASRFGGTPGLSPQSLRIV